MTHKYKVLSSVYRRCNDTKPTESRILRGEGLTLDAARLEVVRAANAFASSKPARHCGEKHGWRLHCGGYSRSIDPQTGRLIEVWYEQEREPGEPKT